MQIEGCREGRPAGPQWNSELGKFPLEHSIGTIGVGQLFHSGHGGAHIEYPNRWAGEHPEGEERMFHSLRVKHHSWARARLLTAFLQSRVTATRGSSRSGDCSSCEECKTPLRRWTMCVALCLVLTPNCRTFGLDF